MAPEPLQDLPMGGTEGLLEYMEKQLAKQQEMLDRAATKQSEEPGMKQPAGMDSAKPADTAQTVATGGDAASRATYADLKGSANGDGKVSRNEQTALDMFADKVGIKEQPANGLDQVLKDLISASTRNDGKIDTREAQAIAAVVVAMGGKSALSKDDVFQMLSTFMKGSVADGEFSNVDLDAFRELLSLADAKPSDGGGSEIPSSSSGGSFERPSGLGFAAQNRFGNLSNGFASQMRFMQAAAGGGAAGGGMQTAEDQQKSEKGASV